MTLSETVWSSAVASIIARSALARDSRVGLGGQVFSAFAGEQDVITDDPEDPSRRLIRQVLGAVAQYQRSLIWLRLRNDRRREAERGRQACRSAPPGWRGDEGALVEPAEATAVDRILELAATGASTRSIATALTAEGFLLRVAVRVSDLAGGGVVEEVEVQAGDDHCGQEHQGAG